MALLSLTLIIPACSLHHVQQNRFLFTQNEAAKLDLNQLPEKDWYRYVNQNFIGSRGASMDGPRIEITYPPMTTTAFGQTINTFSPTRLNVAFIQNDTGKPVDMSTLKVIGKKGWFTKTLTDAIRPYVKGTNIEASGLNIPTGKFHLEVSVADTDGAKTIEKYILVVGEE
jgi:hypothetical protein